MHATRGLPAAFVVLFAGVALATPASALLAAGIPAPSEPLTDAATSTDTTTAPVDSTPAGAALLPDSLAGKPAFALGDSLASMQTRLAELDSARTRLAEKDRRVFDELVAASREMLEAGDLEAAGLAIDDALLFVRRRPR